MSGQSTNLNPAKSRPLVLFEYFLLILCLCVIALRTTLTESLSAQPTDTSTTFADITYSLTISAVLLCSFVCWFIWSFCSSRFHYRLSGIEIGAGLFCAAACFAALAASNKRGAITDSLATIAPVLFAILLVQILDSDAKVRLVLIVIAALGVVSAWQCKEQLFFWNDQQIKFYEHNPETILARQNITAGTLQHFQFEHRLYSKGVNGFFTTRNSAGAFLLLALLAAVALVAEQFKNRPPDRPSLLLSVPSVLAAGAILFGLAITKSKAAIAAAMLAAVMLGVYFCFNTWLKVHKKAVLICCLLLVITGASVFVAYGLTHERLPSGSSMLVRWQYWVASAQMYADHPLTGVGPGNFGCFYTHYKPPAAIESVADPHNLLLSILTRYGPLGLIGFLALVFVPLWKIIFPGPAAAPQQIVQSGPKFWKPAALSAIVISAVLLLIRPMLLTIPEAGSPEEKSAAALILYIMPVIIFAISLLLLAIATHNKRNTQSRLIGIRNTNTTVAVLFCASLACLGHNLLDFAIFEPGIFMTFWAVMAALIASDLNQKSRQRLVVTAPPYAKAMVAGAALAIIWACFNLGVVGPVKSVSQLEKAKHAAALGQFGQAQKLLDAAAGDDYLSPAAPAFCAQLYLQQYAAAQSEQKALLLRAEKCLLEAIRRNRADYKNHHRLTSAYALLAETAAGRTRTDWLNFAFDSAERAVGLYPGSARLRIELAKIAEQLDKTDTALGHYKKAVEIEDAFRAQFQEIYPDHEIISRLGEDKYQAAKQRLKELTQQ